MNTLAAEPLEVNPATLDTTLEDKEYDAWLEANADRLAEESEAADMAESFLRF